MTHYVVRRRRLGRTSCREIQRMSENGIVAVRNDNLPDRFDGYVFRWGCTSTLPNHEGATIVNEASAIHWASDKRNSRLDMQAQGISVPKTWQSYFDLGHDYWDSYLPHDVRVVLRPSTHSQGRNLDVYGRYQESDLISKCRSYGEGNYYVSLLIDKVAEYRVFVVCGRVTCVASKTPADPSAVAWNVAQGGSFENVRWDDWPLRVLEEAVKAAAVSGLDFCGVDVMVDRDGVPYILELNSAPSLTSPYRQRCMARAFDYIIRNGKAHMQLGDKPGWRRYIHPGVWRRDEQAAQV